MVSHCHKSLFVPLFSLFIIHLYLLFMLQISSDDVFKTTKQLAVHKEMLHIIYLTTKHIVYTPTLYFSIFLPPLLFHMQYRRLLPVR
jgi:hypothetical protein